MCIPSVGLQIAFSKQSLKILLNAFIKVSFSVIEFPAFWLPYRIQVIVFALQGNWMPNQVPRRSKFSPQSKSFVQKYAKKIPKRLQKLTIL